MASSLMLGRFDLLDLSSSVIIAPGWDRGAAVPSVSEIVSTVLDGAAVTGRAASNRTIEIPIIVRGTNRLTAAGLANEVLQYVDQASWGLVFTPNGGKAVVYDCFRASVKVTSELLADAEGFQAFTITCEALPYGRSVLTQSAAITATGLTIDTFTTLPTVAPGPDTRANGALGTVAIVSAPTPPDGTTSLSVAITASNYQQLTVARTGMSVTVGTALTTVMFHAQQTFGFHTPMVAFGTQWQLDVTVGGVTYTAFSSDVALYERWTPITFSLAVPVGTITGYKITTPIFGNRNFGDPSEFLYIDYLHGFASTGSLVSSTNGNFTTIPNVAGSARTPVALALARTNASAFKSWCVHVPPPDMPFAQPLLPINGASNTTYTTSAGVRYGGTYSVWLSAVFASTGSGRTVAFTQSAPTGVGTVTLTATIPAIGAALVYLGEITLPLVDYPDDASVTTTVTTSSFSASDAIDAVLLLDTRGQTTIVDATAPSYVGAWIDIPPPVLAFGGVYSGPTRATATSVSSHLPVASTMYFNPGTTNVLFCSPEGPLTVTYTYFPKWLQEATT